MTNQIQQRCTIFILTAALATAGSTRAGQPVYPAKDWQHSTPANSGMDEQHLKAFSKFVGGRGCVVRLGRIAYTWGDYKKRGDVASAAKPIYSFFLMLALQLGKITGLDERVNKWEPRLNDINKQAGNPDRDITWRHLANQTSCYGLAEKPGAAYAYNDWQMALFWDALFLKVYKADYKNVDRKVLQPLLTEKLQCQDQPTFMAFGTKNRPGRLAISPRDFARFGLLFLRAGKWKNDRILAAKYVKMCATNPVSNNIPRAGKKAAKMIAGQRSIGSTRIPDNQSPHFGGYSWLWWINGKDINGQRMWPDAPPDTYGAFGHGGQRAMWVIPSLDIVVSYNDAKLRQWTNGPQAPTNQAMKLLLAAVN